MTSVRLVSYDGGAPMLAAGPLCSASTKTARPPGWFLQWIEGRRDLEFSEVKMGQANHDSKIIQILVREGMRKNDTNNHIGVKRQKKAAVPSKNGL